MVAALSILLLGTTLTNAWPLVWCFSLFGFAAGLSFPSSNAGAMSCFSKNRALASAVLVTTVFGTTAVMSVLLGNLDATAPRTIAYVMIALKHSAVDCGDHASLETTD